MDKSQHGRPAQLKIEFKIVEQMGPYPVPRLIEAHGREILVVTVELEPPGAPLFRPRAGRVQEPAPDAAPQEHIKSEAKRS